MHNIKFQQGWQFLAVHPKVALIFGRHTVDCQINITVIAVIATRAGTEQHKALGTILLGQCGQLRVKLIHKYLRFGFVYRQIGH